jgi:CRISPR/Cas system-associated endonuclease Cas1
MADETKVQKVASNFKFVSWLITKSKNVQELKYKLSTISNFDVNRLYMITEKSSTPIPLIAAACIFCAYTEVTVELVDFLLLTYNTNINIEIIGGKTIVSHVARRGRTHFVRILISHGVDTDFVDSRGKTLIYYVPEEHKKYVRHYIYTYKNVSFVKPVVNK